MLFEWLTDYQQLKQDISYLEFNLERNITELKRWTSGDLSGVPLQRESLGANIEEVIVKIENELDYKRGKLQQLTDLIEKFQGLDNMILKLKYIDGMTLEEIAERLNYSNSHIKKKHAELVRLLRFVEKHGVI